MVREVGGCNGCACDWAPGQAEAHAGGSFTCSSAESDLLMWFDSRSLSPSTPEIAMRSDPARSTRWHLFME